MRISLPAAVLTSVMALTAIPTISSALDASMYTTTSTGRTTRACLDFKLQFHKDAKVAARNWRADHPMRRTLAWRKEYRDWRKDTNAELRAMLQDFRNGNCGQSSSSSTSSWMSSSWSSWMSSSSSSSSSSLSSLSSSSSSSSLSSSAVSVSVAPETMTARIENFVFYPSTIRVRKGTTVTWTNNDSIIHTVTADSNTGFSSASLKQGESFSYTFKDVGFFPYHDSLHTGMTGTVEVVD